MWRKKLIPVAALALTCLLAAGCSTATDLGQPAGLPPLQTYEQAWQSGFDDAMDGLMSNALVPAAISEEYKAGYQAGVKFKADYSANPLLLQPLNPYAPAPAPAGYQTPSASGGG